VLSCEARNALQVVLSGGEILFDQQFGALTQQRESRHRALLSRAGRVQRLARRYSARRRGQARRRNHPGADDGGIEGRLEGKLKELVGVQDRVPITITEDGVLIEIIDKDKQAFFELSSATIKPRCAGYWN
jgi:hypothetical protein